MRIKYFQQAQRQNAQGNLLQATNSQQQMSTASARTNIGIATNAPSTSDVDEDVDEDSDDDSPVTHIGNSSATKGWHDSIKTEYRSHVINELWRAILPPENRRKRLCKDFSLDVRKIEDDIYKCADSEDEYHRLIAENIYKLHQKMKEESEQAERNLSHIG